MTTISHGIMTAYSGLQAMQQSIETTSNNIANSETKGYSRQTAVLAPNDAYTVPGMQFHGAQQGQIGAGVHVSMMQRARDQFVDKSIRLESGVQGEAQANAQGLQRVEAAFNEIEGDALTVVLQKFYDSWQELALHPDNLATRTAVVETAKDVSNQMNTLVNTIRRAQKDTDEQVDLTVAEVNRDLTQVAQLNKRITESVQSGDQPNDLLDQRDRIFDELATMGNFKFVPLNDGVVNVTLNGLYLVDRDAVSPLKSVFKAGGVAGFQAVAPGALKAGDLIINGVSIVDSATPVAVATPRDLVNLINAKMQATKGVSADLDTNGQLVLRSTGDGTQTISVGVTGVGLTVSGMKNDLYQVTNGHEVQFADGRTADLTTGQLKGLMKTVQVDTPAILKQVDQLANTLITRVNGLHASGYNLYKNTGSPFFTGTQAKDMAVSTTIQADVRLIAAAVNPLSPPGDGNRSLDIAALKNQPLMSGRTTEDFYNNLLSKVGFAVAQAQDKVKNQDQILNGLESRRQEVSGVSMDEEFANLIRFQRAYQGASRMVSVFNDMMGDLLNMIR
ncbi:MAG: flagellar hook-associated protein FlgK [Candidatus Sericytochromatia bacterium]|nr:flagellar hook-associated protein FlgK [Candidatus Sericytochromatia bacterium]